jgi:hypothetical protein
MALQAHRIELTDDAATKGQVVTRGIVRQFGTNQP